MAEDLCRLDAIAQAELVRRGEATPRELVEAAIARIEKLNPELGAVIWTAFERARRDTASPLPDGPFRGVPLLLKDLGAHLAGEPCHNGMRLLKEARWTEPGETFFAGALREAGFVSLGRTNTPELGLLPTSEPDAYPPTRNPFDPARSAGGSSGGAAAAVASGMVPVAHASDGGGSIRIPAAHCGLVGLKPSRGRNSFGPDLGERWIGFSAEGFVTRSVRDTAALLDLVSGPRPGDPYVAPPPARPFAAELGAPPGRLRVGFLARGTRGVQIHAECAAAAVETARLLESLGHGVEENHPAAMDEPEAVGGYVRVVACSVAAGLERWGEKLGRAVGPGDVEPLTWAVAEIGRRTRVEELLATLDCNHARNRRLAAWWRPGAWRPSAGPTAAGGEDGFDLLVTPTTGEPAPPLGEFAPRPDQPLHGFLRAAVFGLFTTHFNVSGLPAVSLPLHWTPEGLPVGVQLVAAYGREDLLLRVAAQLEAARPWAGRRPGLHA
jgi:amidase